MVGGSAIAYDRTMESPEQHAISAHDVLGRLTPREVDVLRRAATGRTNADVAADLGVTVHAVKFHLASIFQKLDVHNRTQAAAWYLASAQTPRD